MSSQSNATTATVGVRTPPGPADPSSAPRDVGRAGLTAGVALLLLAGLAAFGVFVAVRGLVTPGDADTTANDILPHSCSSAPT